MPALYAHKYFGDLVKSKLDKKYKDLINKYPKEFNIGLQGPDIFFFYHCFYFNKYNQFGRFIHRNNSFYFFQNAAKLNLDFNCAATSYLLGFICHYILDSELHPDVNKGMKICNCSHAEIECNLDHLIISKFLEKVSHFKGYKLIDYKNINLDFYIFYKDLFATYSDKNSFNSGDISPNIIYKSIKWMRLTRHFFYAPKPSLKLIFFKIISLIKPIKKYILGHVLREPIDNNCKDYVDFLFSKFDLCSDKAIIAINDFYNNKLELFNKDFMGK